MILTDKDARSLWMALLKETAGPLPVEEFARSIEAAILTKLREQEPVAWLHKGDGGVVSAYEKETNSCEFSPDYLAEFNVPLFLHLSADAPSVWETVVDEALVGAHLGVANTSDSYESAKAKLNELICWSVDVDKALSADAQDAARYRWLRDTQNSATRESGEFFDKVGVVENIMVIVGSGCAEAPHAIELDAAIDTAMKGQL